MYTVLLTPQKEIVFDTHSWYMFKVKEAVFSKPSTEFKIGQGCFSQGFEINVCDFHHYQR